MLLLLSLLSGIFVVLRGIENIAYVVGILAAAALVGIIAKKQRDAENPYRSHDPPDYEIH